jgi:hypothetical protein
MRLETFNAKLINTVSTVPYGAVPFFFFFSFVIYKGESGTSGTMNKVTVQRLFCIIFKIIPDNARYNRSTS